MNSIANISHVPNTQNVAAQAQPLQSKEAVNERVAVAQTKNEKKVKEEKEKKKKNSSGRSKKNKKDKEEIKTEAIDHASVNVSSILIAQEMKQSKKLVTPAKAAGAYQFYKNS
jgi:hypothetical protein